MVLALDVMTGSRLQLNTLMGYNAIIAGRFYGFGNQAFSLFAVAAILSAAWLAERPVRAGRRAAAAAIIAAVGAAAVAVDGAAAVAVDGLPFWGSDFGGVIAMVPAFAVLGMMAVGQRVSPVRLGLACLVGAALVLLISYLNSRSANPTHLGRFWQDLVSGDAWDVVVRKFRAMVRSLRYWPFTIALAGAIAFLYFVLMRPVKWRAWAPFVAAALELGVGTGGRAYAGLLGRRAARRRLVVAGHVESRRPEHGCGGRTTRVRAGRALVVRGRVGTGDGDVGKKGGLRPRGAAVSRCHRWTVAAQGGDGPPRRRVGAPPSSNWA
ncbi:hypothetical protein Arub01_28720 [Actinomadura rubrobrunea]|uniref:Uncharacterized protein n=1 Tax=Actinomadura rubrobrunea TaxID=115335 RepID=A0A9W6PXD6_9ACTN|nr:hypothetical protein [Actinomadura rubrobrunea]GLW64628.1 hypothetical protein Arub01_28720 [Actinomadura rubrobrunea]